HLLEEVLDLLVVAVIDAYGYPLTAQGIYLLCRLVDGAATGDVHAVSASSQGAGDARSCPATGAGHHGNPVLLRHQIALLASGHIDRQSVMTAVFLPSVMGRASCCSSQILCSLSTVSSRPAPSLLPGVKVAGRCRMPWMTPMVS